MRVGRTVCAQREFGAQHERLAERFLAAETRIRLFGLSLTQADGEVSRQRSDDHRTAEKCERGWGL